MSKRNPISLTPEEKVQEVTTYRMEWAQFLLDAMVQTLPDEKQVIGDEQRLRTVWTEEEMNQLKGKFFWLISPFPLYDPKRDVDVLKVVDRSVAAILSRKRAKSNPKRPENEAGGPAETAGA